MIGYKRWGTRKGLGTVGIPEIYAKKKRSRISRPPDGWIAAPNVSVSWGDTGVRLFSAIMTLSCTREPSRSHPPFDSVSARARIYLRPGAVQRAGGGGQATTGQPCLAIAPPGGRTAPGTKKPSNHKRLDV
nr:hypothetical protein [Pandoravirus massiliensis]